MNSLGLQNKYLRTGSITPVIIKTLYLTLYPMVFSCYINTNCCWHLIWFPWFTQTKTYTPYILCTFLIEPQMLIKGKPLNSPNSPPPPPQRPSEANNGRGTREQWSLQLGSYFSPLTHLSCRSHLCAQWVAKIYRKPTSFPAALAHVRYIKNSNMTPRR